MLEGVTVLDHSTVGPAARCTQILADYGAAVVKVLAHDGRIEPPFYAYGAGRGTSRVRIDLKSTAGRDLFLEMAAGAQVVVESFRPGVAGRLGIGYEACSAANARVVYAAVSGYGATGPYAERAGHDLNYLAVGGFLATQGRRADGGPAMPGATVADSAGGGMHAAVAILSALVRAAATGEGAFLDVSTVEGVLWLTSLAVDEHLATGVEPGPGTSLLTGGYACYDCYRCADGRWLAVAAIEQRFFANLCRALGCEDLAPMQMDPKRQDLIRATFRAVFGTRKRDEWVADLAGADTCVAPVLGVAEVSADPHLIVRHAFAEASHSERGSFRQVAPVFAGAERRRAATAAEGTDPDGVLAAFGVEPERVRSLVSEGVVA